MVCASSLHPKCTSQTFETLVRFCIDGVIGRANWVHFLSSCHREASEAERRGLNLCVWTGRGLPEGKVGSTSSHRDLGKLCIREAPRSTAGCPRTPRRSAPLSLSGVHSGSLDQRCRGTLSSSLAAAEHSRSIRGPRCTQREQVWRAETPES